MRARKIPADTFLSKTKTVGSEGIEPTTNSV